MGKEIERKFLLANDQWRKKGEGTLFRQGYILSDPAKTVRVRICNHKGFLTIKGIGKGISRPEFEYEIPFDDADFLLDNFCEHPILEKIRYRIEHQEMIWEIDEFLGENAGLLLAEIELETENQIFSRPQWVGREVTGITRYYNSSLVKYPYKDWKD